MARAHRVVALALDGVVSLDLACAVQIFGHPADRGGFHGRYELTVASSRRGRVATSDGFDLHVAHGLDRLATADTVVVPGLLPHRPAPPARVSEALRGAHARGARMVSICTGAFVLAHAGLLAGRPATTHWAACEDMHELFPTVELRPEVLYVDDGDILSSAGVASGLDLCLHVVRSDFGADEAVKLARWNVVPPHREGGQAQFIETPMQVDGRAPLAATMAWALQHLDQPLGVPALARHAHMSERTFNRRFRAGTGTTPGRWLLTQRLAHARRLLETTDVAIEQVARQAGFQTADALRVQFSRQTSTTPTAYRRAFRARVR